ncbi:MAG: hypothetical protein GY821_15200 [Gammaproteobacteria bacterium]|nr:hypothetical protein [Gammaproteobacteria bacterium]
MSDRLSINLDNHKIKRVDKPSKNSYLLPENGGISNRYRPGHVVPFALSAGTGNCISYALALAAYLRDKLSGDYAISIVQYYRKGLPYHTFVVVSEGDFNKQKTNKKAFIKKGIVGDAWVKDPKAVKFNEYFCFDDDIPFFDETDDKGNPCQPALDDDDDAASCYVIKYFKPGLSEKIARNEEKPRWERMLKRSKHINEQLNNANDEDPLMIHEDPSEYYNVMSPFDPIVDTDDDSYSDSEYHDANDQVVNNNRNLLGSPVTHFSIPNINLKQQYLTPINLNNTTFGSVI